MEIRNILIVDDDRGARLFLEKALEKEYRVVSVASGSEAADKVKEKSFDVVFIDMVMPEMDGLETLHAIRNLRADTVEVMMTGYAVEDDIKRALDMGACAFLYKPFTRDDIRRVMKTIETGKAPGETEKPKTKEVPAPDLASAFPGEEKIAAKEKQAAEYPKEPLEGLKKPPREYVEKKKRRLIQMVPTKGKLQFKFVRVIALTVLISMLALAAGFHLIFQLVISNAQLGRYAEAQLADVFYWVNVFTGIITFVSVFAAAFFAVQISHKIAGPIYRMETVLGEIIATGKIKKIKIRPKDELHNLVGLINTMMEKCLKNE
ncbi:response regulator [bacterium]|nr:response regulator [bacterium]